jgi:alkylated DNA nucleotide flippase Atl1
MQFVETPEAPDTRPRRSLFDAVVECVSAIPPGRVLSYGDVAELLGTRAPRAVGRALALAGGGIPWWRVVRANGSFAPHLAPAQAQRLGAEGVPVIAGRVDMSAAAGVRWLPGPGEISRFEV